MYCFDLKFHPIFICLIVLAAEAPPEQRTRARKAVNYPGYCGFRFLMQEKLKKFSCSHQTQATHSDENKGSIRGKSRHIVHVQDGGFLLSIGFYANRLHLQLLK